MAKKIDLEKFLTDPAHSEERDFMEGVINAVIDKRKAEAEKNAPKEKGFIETLFGE